MLSTLKGWRGRLNDYHDDLAIRHPSRWLPASRLILGIGFLVLFALELYHGWFAFFSLVAAVVLTSEGLVLLNRQRRWNG